MINEIKFLPITFYYYGAAVKFGDRVGKVGKIEDDFYIEFCERDKQLAAINEIKPILRRLDSMSEQEKFIFGSYHSPIYQDGRMYANSEAFDWLDVNGFDRPRLIDGVHYESLIDTGLAIDAATL